MAKFVPRKKIRLDPEAYQGQRPYFITICTRDSQKHFSHKELAEYVISRMTGIFNESDIEILAYCLMPDHLHLLVGSEKQIDIRNVIKDFKQKTGYEARKQFGLDLWQKRFYDHILRKEEGIEEVAKYILENPVRKGMVDDFRDYPYSGSTVFEF